VETRRDLAGIVVAITDKDTFSIMYFAIFTRVVEKGRVVFNALRPGLGHTTGGIYIAKEYICNSITNFLATIPGLKHCRHFVRPFGNHGRGRGQDDNHIGIGSNYFFEQFDLFAG